MPMRQMFMPPPRGDEKYTASPDAENTGFTSTVASFVIDVVRRDSTSTRLTSYFVRSFLW
jgi:hypothetical protein